MVDHFLGLGCALQATRHEWRHSPERIMHIYVLLQPGECWEVSQNIRQMSFPYVKPVSRSV
jgi:hypothetical protein